jgi:RNA polymerase sigma factor (sigma-70 family)
MRNRGIHVGTTLLATEESDLLERARHGDRAAVASLYALHVAAARRLAVIRAGPDDADDLVADAFARVIAQLLSGRGPTANFRSYLFATVRNRHRDLLRRGDRERPASDQPWLFECAATAEEWLPDSELLAALRSLPPRWQDVLWCVVVQDRPVVEAAHDFGLSPTALTSLAHRARSGLRTAYLTTQQAS